jgi:uncharacterized UPF0160 family protein
LKIATHNGIFHADDVFAIALLLTFFPEAKIVRTRDRTEIDAADMAVDVGGQYDPPKQLFDHHQGTSGARSNNIKYSAFGLIWKEDRYGLKYCDGDRALWQCIDEKLVQFIDADDNGQKTYLVDTTGAEPFTVADLVEMTNPSPLDPEEKNTFDQRFHEAVGFAQMLLPRLKKREADKLRGEKLFAEAYARSADKRYVLLEEYLPFKQQVEKYPDLLYVIYPYELGGKWMVLAASKEAGSFESRLPFPEPWRAKSDQKLAAVCGVDDALFCHATGFIAAVTSREGAVKLAQLSMEQLKT